MVLQDKYKRANSSRYRATHGGIQSNRQKARASAHETPALKSVPPATSTTTVQDQEFPHLLQATAATTTTTALSDHSNPLIQPHSNPSFARRTLDSNAHRYLEPEPDPNEEPEPEIDLTSFVAKQKCKITLLESSKKQEDEGDGGDADVDLAFDDLFKHSTKPMHHHPDHRALYTNGSSSMVVNSKTGKPAKVVIQDPSSLGLEELDNERKKADSTRDLIARFTATQLGPPKSSREASSLRDRRTPAAHARAMTCTTQKNIHRPSSTNSKDHVLPLDDEDFLDQVLNDSSGTYGKSKKA
ncbi:hypothetical protein PCANC_03435 [Puccinia coronata f. sp. avenae]|uniref:Uncharacterized protein n=1 Tax=Puccinia coronata f. sp. avenae TaxID=200324 RepID=A0A2N5W2A8_9BASI|nr:hypothetical protein PCANC_03435 [Puccinia coronata f. sp. avenae]